jgi:hypothetical protein
VEYALNHVEWRRQILRGRHFPHPLILFRTSQLRMPTHFLDQTISKFSDCKAGEGRRMFVLTTNDDGIVRLIHISP